MRSSPVLPLRNERAAILPRRRVTGGRMAAFARFMRCAAYGALLLCLASTAQAERVSSGQEIAAAMSGAQIVILGELHDNPDHHALQAAAIDALSPTAIVFEMLTQEEAATVTRGLAQDAQALAQALNWDNSGWPDFAMYYPLIAFAATGPIYGSEVPRNEAREAISSSAAEVFAASFATDPADFGLDQPLPDQEQSLREAEQMAAHCDALPEDLLPGFVEAQRLRDASLAARALAAFRAHGAPVVIITGNGHARRDWGVPGVIAQAAPDVDVRSLGQLEAPPAADVPFDNWTVTAPLERDDPCAAFR